MKTNLPVWTALIAMTLIVTFLTGCGKISTPKSAQAVGKDSSAPRTVQPKLAPQHREIWLAGGCFWGLEAYMDKLNGVLYANVGYANGNTENPTYEQVCSGKTGHAEAVYVQYDPQKIDLTTLLTYFFKVVNPTTLNKQGNDKGIQYRSGIYYKDAADKVVIDQVIAQQQKKHMSNIVTEVLPLTNYYQAEEYHQKYLAKNPTGYCHIDLSTLDKDPRTKANTPQTDSPKTDSSAVKSPYAKPSEDELRKKLTGMQYHVTQNDGTEKPFLNDYWNNHAVGLYVDVVTGEPLFGSKDKYDSGTGWPSFTKPVAADVLVKKVDNALYQNRVEVRSRYGDSHLGHVFEDGPRDRGGLRYCINSAALRFVPLDKMASEGYGEFISLVE